MKNRFFLAILMAASMFFVACNNGGDEVTVTNLTLDKQTASVKVGETVTITATVEPSGAADVKWESTNTAVATVSNGVVTGVAEGNAIIAATAGSKTASCVVTVTKEGTGTEPVDPSLHPSLQGSEYYVIQLDGISSAAIQSKIVADFRPDDQIKHLYIWENTYAAGSTSGLNFYGEAEGWIALTVGSIGWSGFGYAIDDLTALNKLSAIMAAPNDYYFHIAIKSTDQASHLFGIDGTAGTGKICFGSAPFVDNNVPYAPYANITRDGEWNEYEVPMTYFLDQGLSFGSNNTTGKNIFWGLSGGTSGVTLQYDACFIYKK